LDVGALIIEYLNVTVSPGDRAVPPYEIDGSTLLVGPALIGRREIITFSLLVDGPSPWLRPPIQSLSDVDVQSDLTPRPGYMRAFWIINAMFVVMLLIILIVAATWTNKSKQGAIEFTIFVPRRRVWDVYCCHRCPLCEFATLPLRRGLVHPRTY
jgi:hypothetical protein